MRFQDRFPRCDEKLLDRYPANAVVSDDAHLGIENHQCRRTIRGRYAGHQIAADGAEIPRLHGSDRMRGGDHRGRFLQAHRMRHDFAVGDHTADAKSCVGFLDATKFFQSRNIHQDIDVARCMLHIDDEISAPGQRPGALAVFGE